jgi:hypothetical protein
MYPRVAAKLSTIATKLCAYGFKQTQSKLWLFNLPIKGIGTFFADLGGTEEVPIWEDPTPLCYCKFNDRAAPHEEAIAVLVIDHLVERGIPIRTSFYSSY